MKKVFFLSILVIASLFLFVDGVHARRLLPSLRKTVKNTKPVAASSSSVGAKVKFREDRRAMVANFSNLQLARAINYSLTYNSRGIGQGVDGSIGVNSPTATAEMLFGSCSHGVCTYDTQVSNARLKITITYKSGKKIIKSYRIKV